MSITLQSYINVDDGYPPDVKLPHAFASDPGWSVVNTWCGELVPREMITASWDKVKCEECLAHRSSWNW